MSNQLTQILTPVGRLVQGDCFEPQTTDSEGKPLLIKNGPNAGQPRVDYFMAVAIPKTDAGYNEVWAAIHGVARTAFPSLFDATGTCINPTFAFKVTDGDSIVPNGKGTRPCDREGFPGCWILGFSGGFAPKCYTANGEALITNPEMLKRGYYVRIYGSVKGNGSMQKPGIFLNHAMVELVGYGEAITSGPDGGTVFGGAPAAALPAGASATPLAGSAPLAQAAPAMAAPAMAAPAMAAPAMAAPAMAAPAMAAPAMAAPAMAAPAMAAPAMAAPSNVQPAPDFLAGPAAAAPAPVEVKYLDANGSAFTEAQLLAVGYQPAQIQALTRA